MYVIPKFMCDGSFRGKDIVVFIHLYKECLFLKTERFNIDVHKLKHLYSIKDMRTFKKIINNLEDVNIVKDSSEISRSGIMTIVFNSKIDKGIEIDEETRIELLKLDDSGVRLFLLLKLIMQDNGSIPTYLELKKMLKIGSGNLAKAYRSLKGTNLYDSINIVTKDEFSVGSKLLTDVEIKDSVIDYNHLTEEDIENILIRDISVVEDGMRLLDNQVKVKDGIIDLLCIDSNNRICIIEIKNVEDDDRLVFQCGYYPTQILNNPRMITIAPNYSYRINMALKSFGYVEMKTFKIVDNKIIVNNFQG